MATTTALSMTQFVNRYHVRMTADWADSNPHMSDMPDGSSHWKCVLRHGRKSMTVYFSQGPAISREPTVVDVLDCLASDSANIEDGFENWAEDLGYDTDSRKAEHIYKTVAQQTAALKRLFTDEELALLYGAERL